VTKIVAFFALLGCHTEYVGSYLPTFRDSFEDGPIGCPKSRVANNNVKKGKVMCDRPGVAQRVGRGIAVLFHDRGTRRGWVVSSTPRSLFTPGKDPVPILQEAGWVPGPVWTGGKSRPHRDSIPDRPAHSQSPYRLSYRTQITKYAT